MTMLNADVESLRDFLHVTRLLAGHTTRTMGEAVGVTSGTISNWENGKGEPTVTQFVAWCRETKQPLSRVAEGLLMWCAPRDSNPQPSDWESVAASVAALDVEYQLLCAVEAVAL